MAQWDEEDPWATQWPPAATPPPPSADWMTDAKNEADPPFTPGQTSDNRPPKPPDPGDGRTWIWMGDQWGLTVPESAPFGTGGGGGGGTQGPASGKFDYGRPEGMLPFSAYRAFDYPDFSFASFAPSDRTMLYDDNQNPGFTKSQERLRKMIEAGAAYQGMLKSGNTFDKLGSILSNNEESQFKAFDDRRYRNWMGDRDNAFGAWQANEGEAERDNQRFNDYRYNTEKASFDDMLSRWTSLVNSTTQLALPRD